MSMIDTPGRLPQDKFSAIVMNAPVGILEMDAGGAIIFINTMGDHLLKPILTLLELESHNFHEILRQIAPEILQSVSLYTDEKGMIINKTHRLYLENAGNSKDRHFRIIINKLVKDSYIVAFEDVTEFFEKERAVRDAVVDKAVAQGKFEIAADVLHDIGNGVVGFGSYLTRIRHSLEQHNVENLKNLAAFFTAHQIPLATAIGEVKAAAVVNMLTSLVEADKAYHEDIRQSISKLLSIITHIQEILNIQRQYVAGGETKEKKPTNLRTILNDCLSMLFASIEKRGIAVKMEIVPDTPLVQGDHTKLMQVIMNILKNSIEAIDIASEVKMISICLSMKDQLMTLQVTDTGQGFDEPTRALIFGRGFTTKTSGTGLGLHNCQTILESHAGMIDISSPGAGQGAVTTITFKI